MLTHQHNPWDEATEKHEAMIRQDLMKRAQRWKHGLLTVSEIFESWAPDNHSCASKSDVQGLEECKDAARSDAWSLEKVASDAGNSFFDILFEDAPGGRKSYVRGGLDVWEYVMVARDYNWNEHDAAAHLHEPVERVRLALQYYRAYPEVIDSRFDEMDAIVSDLAGYIELLRSKR
jgi:hypothetical protein